MTAQEQLLSALERCAYLHIDLRDVMHLVEAAYNVTFIDWSAHGNTPGPVLFAPEFKRMKPPARYFAHAWVSLFNVHVHGCPDCSNDPATLRLCSFGAWLNDEASAAAARALFEEANA